MEGFALEQSLPTCIILSVIGGILEVGATAVTAVPAVRDSEGKEMRKWIYWVSVAGNVTLQVLGSLMSHLFATWFGPVSIVVPFFYSATLLANMVIFGAILGLEFFTKNMRVGTYVIVVAVVLLPVVGPTIQESQNINELLSHWYSILWFALLLGLMFLSTILLLLVDITKFSMANRTIILLVARATSISINLTVSRAFVLSPNHTVLVAFIILKLVSGGIYTYAILVQSTAVEQARFVPINVTTIILTNAVTGVIIWEDWRVVASWYGYCCVFALLALGCDLLLSVPLLNGDNPQFGVHKRASVVRQSIPNIRSSVYKYIPDSMVEDEENVDDRVKLSFSSNSFPVTPIKEDEVALDETPKLSTREAWALALVASSRPCDAGPLLEEARPRARSEPTHLRPRISLDGFHQLDRGSWLSTTPTERLQNILGEVSPLIKTECCSENPNN